MAHVLKRLFIKLLWVGVVFLGITVISFWVIHLAPGVTDRLANHPQSRGRHVRPVRSSKSSTASTSHSIFNTPVG